MNYSSSRLFPGRGGRRSTSALLTVTLTLSLALLFLSMPTRRNSLLRKAAAQTSNAPQGVAFIVNSTADPGTNVIDVHVSRLRRKLEDGFERPLLHTVRGAGYMLAA